MTARTSSSRISAAVPGSVASPASFSLQQVVGERHVEPARAFGHLERGEAVHVDRRARPPSPRGRRRRSSRRRSRGGCRPGGTPRSRRTRPPRPRAAASPRARARYGCAAQVERERTLRERAEPALERADVRVVDVAVADERDLVADDLAPQLVGDLGDARDLGAARAEQRDDLVDADLFAGEHAVEHLADRAAGARRRRGGGEQRAAARGRRRPGDHAVVAGEALGVGARRAPAVRTSGCEPLVGIAHVLGVDREARRERRGRRPRSRRAGVRARATAVRGSRGRA